MRLFSQIITILLVIIGITFAVLNASLTKINFYFTEVTLNLSLILVLTFAMGVVLGMMIGLLWYLRLKREVHQLRGDVKHAAESSKDHQG